MKTYSPPQAPRIRALLDARAAKLRDLLSHETDAAHAELSREPEGFSDEAARAAEAEIEESHSARAARELLDIDAALRRIADGSYGCCIDCGAAIDLCRLEAVPATAYCTACQTQHERN
jgi:DnaK suppressor protein